MIFKRDFHRPLTDIDLILAPLEVWEEASETVYLALMDDEESKAKVDTLLYKHFPKISHRQLCDMCRRSNRQVCWELVRWYAVAVSLEKESPGLKYS